MKLVLIKISFWGELGTTNYFEVAFMLYGYIFFCYILFKLSSDFENYFVIYFSFLSVVPSEKIIY